MEEVQNFFDELQFQGEVAKIVFTHAIITDEMVPLLLNLIRYNKFIFTTDPKILHFFGLYEYVKKNYVEMKKFLNMAIELKYTNSMIALAYYYKEIEKNTDEMKKYYLMAIEAGDDNAMFLFGLYNSIIQNNTEQEYINMALEKDNIYAILFKASLLFFSSIEEHLKYITLALDRGSVKAMVLMGCLQLAEKKYDEVKKYYLMAYEKGSIEAMTLLVNFYTDIEKDAEQVKYYCEKIIATRNIVKKEKVSYMIALSNLGTYYFDKKDYENGKIYFEKLFELDLVVQETFEFSNNLYEQNTHIVNFIETPIEIAALLYGRYFQRIEINLVSKSI